MIRLRPAGAADVAAVTDFLAGLEPSAAWLRFGVGLGVPSRAFVHRLVSRGEDRGSWVADVDGGVVAHASWTRLPDGSVGPSATRRARPEPSACASRCCRPTSPRARW